MAENLKLAEEINTYVNSVILYCPNFKARKPETSRKNLFHIEKMYKEICSIVDSKRAHLSARDWYQFSADLFEKYNVGTCGSMTIIGGMKYREKNNNIPITISYIPNGNHQVLVIGQGTSAVICDPWSMCFYPEDRSKLYLRAVRKINPFSDYPLVRKTNESLVKVFLCTEKENS